VGERSIFKLASSPKEFSRRSSSIRALVDYQRLSFWQRLEKAYEALPLPLKTPIVQDVSHHECVGYSN